MTSVAAREERTGRWLLLTSLALNLFLLGAGGALLARHYLAEPARTETPVDRSIAARMERLAATLPPADAAILRSRYRGEAARIDAAREGYLDAQDEVRRILRDEPFAPEAMRKAMVEARASRQGMEQQLQDMIAAAAAQMSPAGRSELANWPPGQRGAAARR